MATCGRAAVKSAIKKEYWTAICDVAHEAGSILNQALTTLETAATNGLRSLRRLLKAQIYALGNLTRPTAPEERMLWTFAATQTEKAFNYYSSPAATDVLTAVRNAARLQGAIGEWVDLMAEAAESSKGCLGADGSGTNAIAGRTALSSTAAQCKLNWDGVKKGETQGSLIGPAGLTGAFANKVVTNTLTGADKGATSIPRTRHSY
ncbi:Trypanosome variant surface glycoprotein (A-type), putative [Trypanosoma equiperdum]|uniref:Trypanosome variant surface glycoprotein (A-type), putative n=1 Tax=Trypanosoma equiperdum TaxID=5694 RepID=A0A1G4IEN2_TRYEQ|nr:Trypanosome variant surface glycoprotein (A-type), putative [Trypanosoma equiperdum]